mmetsp:Transcript_28758/g.31937  ORF Transcript_28758/g.31937 Transcript_28758/m.31937 type:complete len:458 (+) Transcript_28758:68-1441(+)
MEEIPEGAWNSATASFKCDKLFVCMSESCKAKRRSVFWKGSWRFCHRRTNHVLSHIWCVDEQHKGRTWNRKLPEYDKHVARLSKSMAEIPNTSQRIHLQYKIVEGVAKKVPPPPLVLTPPQPILQSPKEEIMPERHEGLSPRRSNRSPKPKALPESEVKPTTKAIARNGRKSKVVSRPIIKKSKTPRAHKNLERIKRLLIDTNTKALLQRSQIMTALEKFKKEPKDRNFTFGTSVKDVYVGMKHPSLTKLQLMAKSCDEYTDPSCTEVVPDFKTETGCGWLGTQFAGVYLRTAKPGLSDPNYFFEYRHDDSIPIGSDENCSLTEDVSDRKRRNRLNYSPSPKRQKLMSLNDSNAISSMPFIPLLDTPENGSSYLRREEVNNDMTTGDLIQFIRRVAPDMKEDNALFPWLKKASVDGLSFNAMAQNPDSLFKENELPFGPKSVLIQLLRRHGERDFTL